MTEATLSITDGGSDLLQFQAAGGTTYLKFDTQHRLVKPAQGAALQNDSMTFLSEIDSSGSGVQGAFEFQFTSATIERFIQFRDNGNAIVAELEVGGQLWFGESASGGSRYIYESYNGPTWTGVHTFDNDVTFNSGNNVSLDGSNAFNGTATFFANTFHRDDIRLHLGSSLDSYLTWDSVGSTLDCFVYDGVSAYNEIWNASLSAFNVVASATFAGGISGDVTFSGGNVEFDSTTQFDGAATFNASLLLADGVPLNVGTDSDLTIQHDGTDNVFTSVIPTGATANGFRFVWDPNADADDEAKMMEWSYDNGTSELPVLSLYPNMSPAWSLEDGPFLVVNHQGTASTDVAFVGIRKTTGQFSGFFQGATGSNTIFYTNDLESFKTIAGGIQAPYQVEFAGSAAEPRLVSRRNNTPNSANFVFRKFSGYDQDPTMKFVEFLDRNPSGYVDIFTIWPEAGQTGGFPNEGGAGIPENMKFSYDDSGHTRGDTYHLYDSVNSTLDLFVDGAEVMNSSSTQLNVVVSSNLAPGALFYSGW
jgi:hypothetical protein